MSEQSPLLSLSPSDHSSSSLRPRSYSESPAASPSPIERFLHKFTFSHSLDESLTDENSPSAALISGRPAAGRGNYQSIQAPASSSRARPAVSIDPVAEKTSEFTEEIAIFSSENFKLLFYLSASVGIAAANSISWKRLLNKFHAVDGSEHNLEFFVSEFSVLLYVLLAGAILAYRWIIVGSISANQRLFPQRKFMMMGLLDSFAGVAGSIGGGCTSGQLQTVINQLNIPVTLGLSRALLGVKYRRTQIIGAALIVLGSLVAAIPSGGDSSLTVWYGPVILILSCIPNSLSNCYKEQNFKQDGLDVYYLTTAVSIYQVIIGFSFFPLLSLPGFGGIPMMEIPKNLYDGWRCFLGDNLSGYECHMSPSPFSLMIIYVLVNFFYNVLLLLITKHGSALLLVIASAISLPITNLIFTMEMFMGDDAEPFSWANAAGLSIVIIGFLLYSLVANSGQSDILLLQSAPGQNVMVTEPAPMIVFRPRARSFDATHSPAWAINVAMRKKGNAKLKEMEDADFVLSTSV